MKKSLALLLILSFIVLSYTAVHQAKADDMYTVMGKVVDRDGNPVSGVTVQLLNDQYVGAQWNFLGTMTSDSNGLFRFTDISSVDNVFKVFLTYNVGGVTYKTGDSDSAWTSATAGIDQIPTMYSTLTNYPPPTYGHLYGVLLSDGSSSYALAGGVIYASSGEQKYYQFAANDGSYDMALPVGQYTVYAQYQANGNIYQTKTYSVTVKGAWGTNWKEDAAQLTIYDSLSTPTGNPNPAAIPGTYTNTVNGTVEYQDGSGISGVAVSLWQSADDVQGSFAKVADATTDANGNYVFNNVKVTADDGTAIYAMKTFEVSATFTDSQGNTHVKNQTFPLYNPNVILGIGQSEVSARNMTAVLQADYSDKGWVEIQSIPSGAKVYVDGQALLGSDGKQLTTPCTAYIAAGYHTVKLSENGYNDVEQPVNMVANLQTQSLNLAMGKPMVPPWVTVAFVVIILLIVIGIILAVLVTKRHMFLGPLGGVLAPLNGAFEGFRSSSATRKAHHDAMKAHAAELKRAESAHRKEMADSSLVSKQKLSGRRRDEELSFGATEQAQLPEHTDDELSMVSARGIYRKAENPGIERISHNQATGNMARNANYGGNAGYGRNADYDSSANYGSFDAPSRGERGEEEEEAYEPPRRNTYSKPSRRSDEPITAEPDGRIRVPKAMPTSRDAPASTIKDKERVIRYIREHQDGISFIQMSNDLEIPPNTLTIITKELVINDDIEKVKGLYYYKSHDSSQDESKSSVVVWRLDGEE